MSEPTPTSPAASAGHRHDEDDDHHAHGRHEFDVIPITQRANNPVAKGALALIRFYRRAISPGLPAACRFQPTCSAYALQAIDRHGVFKGGLLTLRRLLRCHPLSRCRHAYDPVPETFAWADLIGYKHLHSDI